MPRLLRFSPLALSALGILALAPLAPGSSETHAAKSVEAPAPSAAAVLPRLDLAGVKVAIDPRTHHLRPLTPGEARLLAAQMHREFPSARASRPKIGPDGTVSLVVAPDHLSFEMVTIEPDGSVRHACSSGLDPAIAFLESAAAVAGDRKAE